MNKDNMLTEQENQHFNIKETKKNITYISVLQKQYAST